MAPRGSVTEKTWSFLNPAYDSYTSGIAPHDAPYIVSGLNVRTSSRGWIERAPGSDAFDPTSYNTARRTFIYRKWNGDTWAIVNYTNGTSSVVEKMKIGTDATFGPLYTSTTSANTGTTNPTSATFSSTGVAWANPTNIFASEDNRATCTFAVAGTSASLYVSGFNFAIPKGVNIAGIVCEIERSSDLGGSAINDSVVKLMKNLTAVGTNKSGGAWPGADAYATYGSSSDVWGTTWTPEDINSSGFGVEIQAQATVAAVARIDHVRITVYYSLTSPNNIFDFTVANDTLYYGNGWETRSYNGELERKMGITAPTTAPTTTTAGTGITAVSGWRYVYCYKDSVKGHISSPSPTSASTGAVTDDTVTVTVTGTAVTGIDKIQVFRTTDGGNGIFFYLGEVDNPGATTTTYADATADTSLDTQFSRQAPPSNYNDPPPGMRGLKSYANRVWGFIDSTLYYSGWEEINNGLAEESFPSGVTGNIWQAAQQITNLVVIGGESGDVESCLLVVCRSKTYKVTGDNRNTFVFKELFSNFGSPVMSTGHAEDGERAFIFGNDNRVWSTDGVKRELVSEAITDELLNVAATECSMVVHRFGEVSWLVVADAGGGTSAVIATSATSPGTAASVAGSDVDWSNPSNALASDNSYATASLPDGFGSDVLLLTNFGFSIPTNATILGVLVEVEASRSGGGANLTIGGNLYNSGATIGNTVGGQATVTTSDAYISHGSATNLWGANLTPSTINGSTFGVGITIQNFFGGSTSTARVDHVRMTVYYYTPTSPRWFVLDLNTGKWMPPWLKSATHLHSGETTTGNFVLLYTSYDWTGGTSVLRKLMISPETASWQDASTISTTSAANAVFALTELGPAGKVTEITKWQYERDDTGSPTAPTVRSKLDELNSGVTWSSQTALTTNAPTLRTQGTVLVDTQVHDNKSGRRALLRFEWPAENKNFKLLSISAFVREVGREG